MSPDPAEFWGWVKSHNLPIVLAEGAGDSMGALSQGHIAIGLPGHHMAFTPGTADLKPELLWILEGCPRVTIAFDQDTKDKTRRVVDGSRRKVGFALKSIGCMVTVATWDTSQGKGFGDLAPGHQDAALKGAMPLSLWVTQGYLELGREPDVKVNERYLQSPLPLDKPLVGVKSPKGTGKTEALGPLVESVRGNGGAVVLSHRIQLCKAICDRVGLPYIDEIRSAPKGFRAGYGLVVDSLHGDAQCGGFRASEWAGATVVIDEVEQVLWHVLNSKTCQRYRHKILVEFEALLKIAGRVIVLDADLSAPTLEWLEHVTGHKAWVLENEYRPSVAPEAFTYESSHDLLASLNAALENGEKAFVITQSKDVNREFAAKNLETLLNNNHPHLKILRLDADTVADRTHPGYGAVSTINESCQLYDVVIVTPVIETGVSIDIRGHFNGVWGFFPGVTPEPSVRQALARVREDVPRHFWAKTTGHGMVSGRGLSAKACIDWALGNASLALMLAGWDDSEDCITPPDGATLVLWAKMSARINVGLNCQRAILEGNLIREGWQLYAGSPPDEDLKVELKATKAANWEASCEARANAVPLTEIEADRLDRARGLTQSERDSLDRYKAEKIYCIPATPDLFRADDEGLYPRIRLFYYMEMGREALPARESKALTNALESGGGKLWVPDVGRVLLGHKIAALDALNIPGLIEDPDREFRNSDIDLIEWHKKAIHCRQDIHRVLGVALTPTLSPVRALKAILDIAGVELTCIGRDKINGKAGDRVYQIVPFSELNTKILEAWLERDTPEPHTPDPLALIDIHVERVDPDPEPEQISLPIPITWEGEPMLLMGERDGCKLLAFPGTEGDSSCWLAIPGESYHA